MERRERKRGVDGVVEEDQQALANWKHKRVGEGSEGAPVRRMTVAFARAADIRVDDCRKHLARNWERSEGESGAKPACSRRA